MNKPFNHAEETDKLNAFLAGFDDTHNDFLDQARAEGYDLDENYSLDGLEALERYILNKKAAYQPDSADQRFYVYVHAWYQLGEIVRENFGGYWAVSEEDPEPGKWVIKNFKTGTGRHEAEFDPKGMVRRFIRWPGEGVFRRAIGANTDPHFFDESRARRAAIRDEEANEQ